MQTLACHGATSPYRAARRKNTQKTEDSPGVSGWRGLWWALTHTGCGCHGNGLRVYFVADSKLTLFCKYSFPTVSKDSVFSPSLSTSQPSCWALSCQPGMLLLYWEQPPLGVLCRPFTEGLEARSVCLPSPVREGSVCVCVSANKNLRSAVGGAMEPRSAVGGAMIPSSACPMSLCLVQT